MCCRLAWLFACIIGVAVANSSESATAAHERFRLEREVAEALAGLTEVCQEAWRYDNLRPAMNRTKWLEATIL